MRYLPILLLAFAGAGLTACTGPGFGLAPKSGSSTSCSTCEAAHAAAEATAPFAQAAAASAKGGQEASNQPVMTDPTRLTPNTILNSGTGTTTFTKGDTESRRLAGAPSTNLGLVIPNSASAQTGGGANPVVAGLQNYIDHLTTLMETEQGKPIGERDPSLVKQYQAEIAAAFQSMSTAQAATGGMTTNNYHFENSRNVQTASNSSNSGEGAASTETPAAQGAAAKMVEKVGTAAMAPDAPAQPDPSAPSPAGTFPEPKPVEAPK